MSNTTNDTPRKVTKTDEQWREELTPDQYRILRHAGTEFPFTGKYWDHHEDGSYACAGCGTVLFPSETKFDSRCGWPSFFEAAAPDLVELRADTTHGMVRTEVLCRTCGGHLGHVFDDAPQTPTGQRYCINSASLNFQGK